MEHVLQKPRAEACRGICCCGEKAKELLLVE